MSLLPDHWTPEKILAMSDTERLNEVIRTADKEIKDLTDKRIAASQRLTTLRNAEYKYVVRAYFVPETDSGAHDIGHMAYYGVSVIKYPVIDGEVQEGVVVEPKGFRFNQIHFYSDVMKELKRLCEKYKEYDPVCRNEVPDSKRGDYGDL